MEIMVLPGDGIGPEIMKGGIGVLEKLNENYNCKLELKEYDINASTMKSGKYTLSDIIDEARNYKAILKAPMGDPEIRNREGTESGLDIILGMRFQLDLYANVRPVKLIPGVQSVLKTIPDGSSIDYTIIRENSEGLYSSHFGGLVLRDEVAIDNQTITRNGTERISRFAFDLSKKSNGNAEGRKIVTCVDKSNVLKTFAFFRKVFTEVARNYPGISTNYMYADAMTQYMLIHPDQLNVVVSENMFADILSDLGAATVGGLGIAQSANMSDKQGMFEPVHGSAPDIAGKGVANPTAMILSTAMMLDYLGCKKESEVVEKAVYESIANGLTTPDLGGKLSTDDFIAEILRKL